MNFEHVYVKSEMDNALMLFFQMQKFVVPRGTSLRNFRGSDRLNPKGKENIPCRVYFDRYYGPAPELYALFRAVHLMSFFKFMFDGCLKFIKFKFFEF